MRNHNEDTFPKPRDISVASLSEIIWSGGEDCRKAFQERYGEKVDEFAQGLYQVYERFLESDGRVPRDPQSGWTLQFLFSAINSLLTSTHLLVSGLLIPSGNQMRHFAESVAMALMLSHRGLPTFEIFAKEPMDYPHHKVIDRIQRRKIAQKLDLHAAGWKEFREITRFYDHYSHASALAAANMSMLEEPGLVVLGGEFDPGKAEAYIIELSRRVSACPVLEDVVAHAEHLLIETQ